MNEKFGEDLLNEITWNSNSTNLNETTRISTWQYFSTSAAILYAQ